MTSNYEKQVDIGRQYFLKYDPEKLAGDLEKLTQALQGLSADLRRSAEESRKEDDR